MASFLYNRGLLTGPTALAGATVKAMLVNSSYTPNKDHDYVSDGPAANELSGTGYASGFSGSGRKTLASFAATVDDTNDRVYVDATDLTWASIDAGTAAALILYINGSSDADSVLLAYIDSGGFPKTTNGGDLIVEWSSSPIGIVEWESA